MEVAYIGAVLYENPLTLPGGFGRVTTKYPSSAVVNPSSFSN